MALTASDIMERSSAIYNDTGYDRVSDSTADNPNWFQFLDDALKQVILLRPDSYCTTTTMQLTSGTKQSLPTAGIRLMDIIRNMGVDGSTVGTPIFYVDRNVLDMSLSTWHSATEENAVDNYWFDTDNPTVFYVTPPNTGNGYIELVYSINHAALTATTDSIGLKDIFLNPILSWSLYRAFLIDTDSEANWNRANHFYGDTYKSLGIEEKVMQEKSPSNQRKGRGM